MTTNKSALLAIALTALLLLVPVASAMTKPVFAQTTGTYGRLDQTARLNFSDGTSSTSIDQKYFQPADIAGVGGKTVTSLTIQLAAILPSSTDTITSSGVSMTARVLRPDGTYGNIAFTPTISDYNVQKTTGGGYTLYLATIPVSAIQAAVGTAPANFQSEIRVVSGANSAIYGSIGGATRGFYTTQTVTIFSIVVNPQSVQPGPIDNTGGGGTITPTPTEAKPTGRVFSFVVATFEDGSTAKLIDTQIGPFNAASLVAVADQDRRPIKSITYQLKVNMDNDAYSFPATLSFANNAALDNYDAQINGVGLAKQYGNIAKDAATASMPGGANHPASWTLLYMTVQSSATDGRLSNSFKFADGSEVKTGTMNFYVKASTLKLTSSTGKVWNVPIPAQNIAVDLQSYGVSQGGGSCQLNGENCTPTGSAFDMNTLLLAGGIGGAAMVGVAAVRSRKK